MTEQKHILTEDDYIDALDREGLKVRVPRVWLDVEDFGFTAVPGQTPSESQESEQGKESEQESPPAKPARTTVRKD